MPQPQRRRLLGVASLGGRDQGRQMRVGRERPAIETRSGQYQTFDSRRMREREVDGHPGAERQADETGAVDLQVIQLGRAESTEVQES
jgi:hypothetical protein